MQAWVIANQQAGSASAAALDEAAASRPPVRMVRTDTAEAAHRAVNRAVDAGADRLVAAGGDGTVRGVAAALLDRCGPGHPAAPVLGILPCGTGNDLARTLKMPTDMDAALERALTGEPTWLDALRVASETRATWALNAVAGGFAGDVDAVLTDAQKERWGPLAFVLGAAQALPDLDGYETTVQLDDGPAQTIEAVNVIAANGRTIGGGKAVAPLADPTDGWLDLIAVRRGPVRELAGAGARLLTGTWTDHPLVTHRRGHTVTFQSTPPMRFNADGDLWARGEVTVTLVGEALRMAGGIG